MAKIQFCVREACLGQQDKWTSAPSWYLSVGHSVPIQCLKVMHCASVPFGVMFQRLSAQWWKCNPPCPEFPSLIVWTMGSGNILSFQKKKGRGKRRREKRGWRRRRRKREERRRRRRKRAKQEQGAAASGEQNLDRQAGYESGWSRSVAPDEDIKSLALYLGIIRAQRSCC